MNTMDVSISLDLDPHSSDDEVVRQGLRDFNAQITSHRAQHYSVFARNQESNIVGGALTYVGRDSAFIEIVWVHEDFRKQGIASLLLKAAEKEAKKRRCKWAKLDTYEFQAPEFYKKCGYEVYGEVKNYTSDNSKIFFRKRLIP